MLGSRAPASSTARCTAITAATAASIRRVSPFAPWPAGRRGLPRGGPLCRCGGPAASRPSRSAASWWRLRRAPGPIDSVRGRSPAPAGPWPSARRWLWHRHRRWAARRLLLDPCIGARNGFRCCGSTIGPPKTSRAATERW